MHHGKPKVVEPAGIASEELERRLNAQSEQIMKHIDNAFKNLSNEEKQALGFIKKELEAMKNKTWNDRFHDPDFWSAFIYAVLAAGQAVYFFRRQNKDAVRMEKITNEIYDATYQMRQNLEYLAAMIQVNRTTRSANGLVTLPVVTDHALYSLLTMMKAATLWPASATAVRSMRWAFSTKNLRQGNCGIFTARGHG
ncbi:MAG: hypothetical protein KA155_09560 [Alphaproteobacteria bacterium]|nr:hypothetical protein [Alphaproteobacteria bacterium]